MRQKKKIVYSLVLSFKITFISAWHNIKNKFKFGFKFEIKKKKEKIIFKSFKKKHEVVFTSRIMSPLPPKKQKKQKI